jgi:ADP-heptose:LPS heptosyltransferase
MVEQANWARRAWRKVYWWREGRRIRARFPGVEHIVYFGGHGIGDELLCSAPLHELRRRGCTGLGVMTHFPEFFTHSPDVDRVFPVDLRATSLAAHAGIRASSTSYISEQKAPDADVPPPRHIIAEMCRRCGISGQVELRPWVFLQPNERERFASYRGAIAIQSSRRGASLSIGNKEWFPERFQVVVDALRPQHRVVQIGRPEDPALHGAEDLRGKTTPRETAALMANAAGFVGLVGFPMHLARAVDCPSVIIYGGRERPDQSGYSCNENLYTPLPCAPCWRWNTCDYDRQCMTAIQPAHVVAAITRLLARPRGPLAIDHAMLP